ncbi:MAG: DUF418 domain-containing protein [Bacteroidetes bacterium]|nr:MAG: DUF418 domain-containing protein [Bacteroidota bacterium]
MQQQTLQPVAPQERIQTIDIIRGIALLGILVVNMTVDNPGMVPMQGRAGFFDQLAYWSIKFFLDDKFMNIFCFLFGLGFAIQMLRAKEKDSNFIFIYMRRLIVLFLFGAFIKIFITGRGVLDEYAMAGLVLLILYKLPKKFLPWLAVACIFFYWTRDTINRQPKMPSVNKNITIDTAKLDSYVGVYQLSPVLNVILIRKGNKLIEEGPTIHYRLAPFSDSEFFRVDANGRIKFMKDSAGNVDRFVNVNADGRKTTWKKINTDLQLALKEQLKKRKAMKFDQQKITYKKFITRNAKNFWGWVKNITWKDFVLGFLGGILPLFFLGTYAGRRKVFSDIPANRSFFQNTIKWCLIFGTTGIIIPLGYDAFQYINGSPYESYYRLFLWYRLCWDIGAILMALGIIAWLTLLLEKPEWKKRLSFFIPVGRMGLTSYLLSLMIADRFILGDQGFALAGQIGLFLRLLFALAAFVLILIFSHWWFKHFRIGPAEWLWRSLTYLKFQPMRLKGADESEIKQTLNI